MANDQKSHRGLKICCGVTFILIILISVVLIVLFVTVLKPKEPKITTQSVTVKKIRWGFFPVNELNVTLGMVFTVDNRNYGSFEFKNSIAYVNYRGDLVAEAPVNEDTIPAHAKHEMNTTVEIFADKLLANSHFQADYNAGILNFTSSTTLHGKVILFKIFKKKATSYSSCNISVFVIAETADSVCKSTVQF